MTNQKGTAEVTAVTHSKMIDRNLHDLHPNDTAARLVFREWTLSERRAQGITAKELAARVGHTGTWVRSFYRGTNWTIPMVQKITRALGYEIRFEVHIGGLPVAFDWSLSTGYYAKAKAKRRDEATLLDLCTLGEQLRETRCLSTVTVARTLRTGTDMVEKLERGDVPNVMLIKMQRYFRALGAELIINIHRPGEDEPIDTKIQAPASATGTVVNIVEAADRTLVWHSNYPNTVISFPADEWKAWLLEGAKE